MFNFKSSKVKGMTAMFSFLMMTAVTLAQSEAGSALLDAIQIIVNRQPQGF